MATTADDVWRLLGELTETQKESERKFQESDRRLQEIERFPRVCLDATLWYRGGDWH